MENITSSMKYWSKVIIFDDDLNLYLEKAHKKSWWKLWLFWWTKEWNESPEDTLIRELWEADELWIKVKKENFKYEDFIGPFKFHFWEYMVTRFSMRISKDVRDIIAKRDNVLVLSLEELEKIEPSKFIINREIFLSRIRNVLSNFNNDIWDLRN